MIYHYYISDPGSVIRNLEVPEEIVQYCDYFTYNAPRDDLRHIDCVYMNMGEYGNDPKMLEKIRSTPRPIF
jgi:hypothetical protein|tara:strand:+ start:449 stop:661 length:213 start_codon:yes stop_codon:yes gene_type:complete